MKSYEDRAVMYDALIGTRIQRLAAAVSLLDQSEAHLYASTYASDGGGSKTWSQWYEDVRDTVTILRNANREAREELARMIGAKKPWTEVQIDSADEAAILRYVQEFYFGS